MDLEELSSRFAKAYAIRFGDSDIEWKPTQYRDKKSGQMVEGKPLAYLNWAVAWRAMLEVYPDANYGVIENPEGSPLWNVNGYGMVKCYVEAMGIRRVETFPIMQGGRNDSMKTEEIDGRDVNDSIQRGLTKAIARWGIGLYIYEGKAEATKEAKTVRVEQSPKATANEAVAPRNAPKQDDMRLTPTAYKFLDGILKQKGVAIPNFRKAFGCDYELLTYGQYRGIVEQLKAMPNAEEDDQPF